MKECRKAEKSFGKTGKNNDPWALALYDFCCERVDQLRETFQKYDGDSTQTISRDDFIDALETVGAPVPDENDIKKLITAHSSSREGDMPYEDFLTGKKYVNKQYLMSAFEGKKKKKKGKKGGNRHRRFKAVQIYDFTRTYKKIYPLIRYGLYYPYTLIPRLSILSVWVNSQFPHYLQ